jgi:hypothetical protein
MAWAHSGINAKRRSGTDASTSIVGSRLRVHGFDEPPVADAFVSEDYERQHLASSIVIGELAVSYIIRGL